MAPRDGSTAGVTSDDVRVARDAGYIRPMEQGSLTSVGLRGLPLVERVIREQAAGRAHIPDFHPLFGGERAAPSGHWLGGRPVPPSLHRWLEVDGGWLQGLADAPVRIAGLVERTFGPGTGSAFRELQNHLLPEPCALLPGVGETSARFLYLGPTDVHGEYTVLGVDIAEPPRVFVWSPGFDGWLAEEAGLIDVDRLEGQGLEEVPGWATAMERAARRVLGGPLEVLAEGSPSSAILAGIDVD
jgi:hypothetical protein